MSLPSNSKKRLLQSTPSAEGPSADGPPGTRVFKLAPNGSGGYVESVLHAFIAGTDGAIPQTGLITDSAGKLYGTTANGGNITCNNGCGTAFEITQ